MTTFQVVTLPLLVVAALLAVVAMRRRVINSRAGLVWSFLWLAAAVSIAFPEIPAWVAHFLGIGRGADLVLYLSILFMFTVSFMLFVRYRRLSDNITAIVRQLAIRDAEDELRRSNRV